MEKLIAVDDCAPVPLKSARKAAVAGTLVKRSKKDQFLTPSSGVSSPGIIYLY